MKVCSISLALREVKAKTILRYHFTSTRIATIKKTKKKKNTPKTKFGKDAEKL